jgi:hypothetical protein
MTNKFDHVPMAAQSEATGLQPDPVVEAYKRDIDRTLLRENLKLTVEQRFLKLCDLQRLATELRKAGSAISS